MGSRIRENWERKKRSGKEGLIFEYGARNAFQKVDNFTEIESDQPSLIAFHNKFMKEITSAYTIGSYYPALTGACALGERILNHLILRLRDYYKATAEYQKVYRKSSFDNWDLAINTLEAWDVLLPDVVQSFKELKTIRHRSIHFNPDTESDCKRISQEAILKLKEIIKGQFSGFGNQPWYIDGTLGACYGKNLMK